MLEIMIPALTIFRIIIAYDASFFEADMFYMN